MIDEMDSRRLARYFAGECSAEEAQATAAWLAADPERRAEADGLRELWRASAQPSWSPDSTAAWKRLSARIHVGEARTPLGIVGARASKPSLKFHWQSNTTTRAIMPSLVAAAALIAIGLGFQEVRERATRGTARATHAAAASEMREFRTARGQRAVITLGDGSRVELGAESVLRVKPFGAGPRVLFLEGQAAFDVVHDSAHAFEVRSANAITEDLGTRFTIRAYRGESHVQVLVASGRVALRAIGSPASSGTLLGPMDLGILDSIGRATVRNGVDSTSYLAWTRDRLVFENAPLSEVIPEVSRQFDIEIVVPDKSLLTERVTINVPARTISEVIGAITAPLKLQYTKRGSAIVIR